ncbi:ATP-binding protein [Salipaludibacillus aurantiacus]|uniref:AAA ATPase domain-containing protein n=1 Tax=Salipaludibacillus aurantiacus TaxID=1601833 RepID=A0A1H9UUJ0_9BACI|nr:ATP-binding protein [Salipaludibacillus aurantiacus]SES13028.1 AAA ATPase domain-containing protein [Salipaludibacillus aurantiacus]
MKIEVNSNRISLSPDVNNDVRISNDVLDEIIGQLKQELLYGVNSSFLVSGYRGAGKTTLVNRLIKMLYNEKIVFVNLNFTKYEKHTLVLRKLIRELYLSLYDSNKLKEIESKKLRDQIKLLYDHTFFDISSYSNLSNIKESNFRISNNIELKKLLKTIFPITAIVFSSFNLSFNFLPFILNQINIIALLGSIVWLLVDLVKINNNYQKTKTVSEENTRKSLYDDEIAEYHLKDILGKLKEEGIKTVFVLDELDKIDNELEMEGLISDFKPLLLSNLATFIVISGQKLYYKLLASNILDDSLMTSIFSKNIHVPLASDFELEKVFDSYLKNKNDMENNLIKYYRNSLILNSNRTLRRFINLTLKDLKWEESKSYLEVDEDNEVLYKTDTKILEILNKIIEEKIDLMEYEEGVRDFLTYQLYIWIKKMKLKGSTYFTLEEIFNFEEDFSVIYPLWYKVELNDLCNDLAGELILEKLLFKKEADETDEVLYRWTNQAKIKATGIQNDISDSKIKFLEEMITIEKYAREIIEDLKLSEDSKKINLVNMVKLLIDKGIINKRWLNESYSNLFKLSNKIRHGHNLSMEEVDTIIKNRNRIILMISELIEGYCYYIVNNYLTNYGYLITSNEKINNTNYKADIIAKSDSKHDILFEIIYKNSISTQDFSRISRLINLLSSYNKASNKCNKLVVLWFSKDGSRKAFDHFNHKLHKLIHEYDSEVKDSIYLFYASDYRTNFNTTTMKAYLDNFI